MSTTTIFAHVNRALEFTAKNDKYFAIAKTAPWSNDNLPPKPDFGTANLTGVIGYKKVERMHLVVPDVNGSISYRDSKWRQIDRNDAMQERSRWVYLECTLMYDELPLQTYRQIGLFSGLEMEENVPPGKYALLPNEVQNPGILEVVDNRKPSSREIDQKEIISLIVEF